MYSFDAKQQQRRQFLPERIQMRVLRRKQHTDLLSRRQRGNRSAVQQQQPIQYSSTSPPVDRRSANLPAANPHHNAIRAHRQPRRRHAVLLHHFHIQLHRVDTHHVHPKRRRIHHRHRVDCAFVPRNRRGSGASDAVRACLLGAGQCEQQRSGCQSGGGRVRGYVCGGGGDDGADGREGECCAGRWES